MITSVERAFFHSGCLNAGTPFEIASTPVTAAPPEANARKTTNSAAPMNNPLPGVPKGTMPAGRVGRQFPVDIRTGRRRAAPPCSDEEVGRDGARA